jgi:hypothetical protein
MDDQVLVVRPRVVNAGAPPVRRWPPALRHHDAAVAARLVHHRVEEVGVGQPVRRVGHRRRARLEQRVVEVDAPVELVREVGVHVGQQWRAVNLLARNCTTGDITPGVLEHAGGRGFILCRKSFYGRGAVVAVDAACWHQTTADSSDFAYRSGSAPIFFSRRLCSAVKSTADLAPLPPSRSAGRDALTLHRPASSLLATST